MDLEKYQSDLKPRNEGNLKGFIQFQIHVPTKKETDKITNVLLNKHLAACINLNKSNANYWWKGKIEHEDIWVINGFSIAKNKAIIIAETKKYHSDEVPGIVFWEIDANKDFLDWIKEYCK